ncbi:hypothetical protein DKAM_0564 [Desulfurococcus amylolyticus 1221n]|uniref:Uncharacterized protein n=1 Tax=Desulfurococcus amylolyticus (strain DSM 18924 / JCM 16383 / VKM B-2413 / 1221n) TaxID=490899 RepID=B8D459_DESA1|nr:hypothetical protein DKAM_0564 [Desulfurococcus amylolyticus 1221n]
MISYVKRGGCARLRGKFAGAFRVASTWFREEKPLWPGEVREAGPSTCGEPGWSP